MSFRDLKEFFGLISKGNKIATLLFFLLTVALYVVGDFQVAVFISFIAGMHFGEAVTEPVRKLQAERIKRS